MTTAQTTADTILAIDLGKYKSMACVSRAADELLFHPTHAPARVDLAAGATPTGWISKRGPKTLRKFVKGG